MNKIKNQQTLLGCLSAIGATAMWSGNFVIARDLNDTVPPISLAFWRWLVAVIAFLPFALKPLVNEMDVLKKHLPYLCITSILGISTFNTLLYIASHTSSALNLSLISIIFPIFMLILSRIFYHELITLNKWLGIILVAAGVLILISRGALSKILNKYPTNNFLTI